MIVARAIMAASRLGLFESLAVGPRTAVQLASERRLNLYATEKLLSALVATDYIWYRAGRFRLTRKAKKWMLPESTVSLHDNMQLRYLEWQAMERLEQFVTTGHAVNAHNTIGADDWPTYQRGLASVARLAASEIARRIPLSPTPHSMLDIGGAHGQYAAAICKRFPTLSAVVLELPTAIDSAMLVFQEMAGDDQQILQRVQYRSGDALREPLGQAEYDLVFISQLIHHFSESENRDLFCRGAASLREGGILAIVDAIRPAQHGSQSQTTQALDLFFAVTSKSGTWPLEQIQAWQVAAGLTPLSAMAVRMLPGVSLVAARKGK